MYNAGNHIYYTLANHPGNTTHVLNSSITVAYEYSYDAWGRRRDKDTWLYTLRREPELFAGRGFTAHEELPWFNLANMNYCDKRTQHQTCLNYAERNNDGRRQRLGYDPNHINPAFR